MKFKMNTVLVVCSLILLLFIPRLVLAVTSTFGVVAKSDDAKEIADGEMKRAQDLLPFRSIATVGVRFNNITIPQGSVISDAYIKFRSQGDYSGLSTIAIYGESNSNPTTFTTADYNITHRTLTGSVNWSPPTWVAGHDYDTSKLTALVQGMVDTTSWSSGSAMVFIFKTSAGDRRAVSRNGSTSNAPQLVIEYTSSASGPTNPKIYVAPEGSLGAGTVFGSDAQSKTFTLSNLGGSTLNYTVSEAADWLGCSPTSGNLAAGASTSITVTYNTSSLVASNYTASIGITDRDVDNDGKADPLDYQARLRITPVDTSGACGDVPVYTENLVNPAIMILFDVSGSMDWQAPLVSAGNSKSKTPDITAIVQEIVNRSGWQSGNRMSFIVTGSGERVAVSYNASPDQAPLLHVEYEGGHIDVPIDQSSDDAENGDLSSSDLDFGLYDVGLRFRDITIPQGVNILNAYIEFYISDDDSAATSLTIKGEDVDNSTTFTTDSNDITGRTVTTSSVSWNSIPAWDTTPTERRIKIGKDVLGDLIKDRSISWGFGTWSGRYASGSNYTNIHVGTKPYSATHEQDLLTAIAAAYPSGGTPLTPSLLAGKDYFSGTRADIKNNETYADPGCQPKLIINISDGLGNTGTSTYNVGTTTKLLTDAGISVVGVGFAIDNAVQLDKLAEVSNDEGSADDSDDIYALHKEDSSGVGKPFIANSKDELIAALSAVTSSLKSQVFYGSAPAATTSVDYGNIVISAQFSPKDWSGDLIATRYNIDGTLGAVQWSARDEMPEGSEINAFTLDSSNDIVSYADTSLYKFYLCKPLGDIINSTPKVVGDPAFYYSFDNYNTFRNLRRGRTKLVYVGSNDGALHAFNLETGIEEWRFYPKSLQSELNTNLVNTNKDLCFASRKPPGEYCHKYFVDGPSIAADVFDGSDWSTILVTGLGMGGASYFSLDVSGGDTFGTGSDNTKFLWEFTDGQLGFASNEPAIGRVGSGSSTQWGVFFGSGYSEVTVSQQATKEAYLFALNVKDKTSLWQDSSGTSINKVKVSSSTLQNDALSSPLIVDIDDDDINDFIYTGNLYGSMYRFSNIGDGDTPVVSKLLDLGSTGHQHPITAAATYAYDETDENVWIYVGTGKYEDTNDKTTMFQQYFVGLRDSDSLRQSAEDSTNATYAFNSVTNTVESTSEPIKILSIKTATKTYVDGSHATVRYIDGISDAEGSWLLKLSNSEVQMIGSERVTSKPIVVGGVVYFRTFVPDLDVCAGNGESRAYSLDYKTGTPVNISYDGSYESDDYVTVDEIEYLIVGEKSGSGESSDLVFDGKNIWSNTTVDGVSSSPTNVEDLAVKLKSWREQ